MLTLTEPPSATCAAVGRRLRDLRIQSQLRQQDVADRSGIPLSTYRLMERQGAGSLENFVKVADLLGASSALQSLFQPEEEPQSLDAVLRRQKRQSRVRHAAA